MRVRCFSVIVGLMLHLNFQAAGFQLQKSDVVYSLGMCSLSLSERRMCMTTKQFPAESRQSRFDALSGVASACSIMGRKLSTLSGLGRMRFRKSRTGVSGIGMMADYMFGMEGISLQPGDRAFIIGADIKRDKYELFQPILFCLLFLIFQIMEEFFLRFL